jgi:hypothetical protein
MMGTKTWRTIALVAACYAVSPALGTANWASLSYGITVPTHVNARGQSCTGSVVMTLMHDAPCSIAVSVGGAGHEVLTNAGDSLATSYKFTGPTLQNPDATWVNSSAFLTHSYNVLGTGPVDSITLAVEGTAASDHAVESGNYTADLVFTVSW